jgi:hypothetical protein
MKGIKFLLISIFLFVHSGPANAQHLICSGKRAMVIKYLNECHNLHETNKDTIENHLRVLKKLEQTCYNRDDDKLLLYYVMARYYCALGNNSCNYYYKASLHYCRTSEQYLADHIYTCISLCELSNSNTPPFVPDFAPNNQAGVTTFAKINQPNSPHYDSIVTHYLI